MRIANANPLPVFRRVLLAALLLPGVAAASEPEQNTAERITEAADRFLKSFSQKQAQKGREVEYEIGSVDNRLSLNRCPQPLEVEFAGDPKRSTRSTLLVSCEGDRPWRIFLSATVRIQVDGWVAERPISRGERLSSNMLRSSQVVLNEQRRSGFRDAEHMIGMQARRTIRAGTAITPRMLEKPLAVERGDRVVISAGNDVFSITTRGKAERSGRVGEQIPVVNENSGRRIRGRITEPGRVAIN
ncbi:flagellar basal body P-ring formation chaperone FlgA [Vreelandella utahensis]|uniref:flagellar basal body P-ring formation chaperone FlgA n=1 Tax=Vreelandella halophila TaxID=86177 RepID=UPI001FE641EB|nr:flagellar basal body P-ring formation chaperone FlgA [Halomonas utahensis]